ncbi:hypothetical protein G7Y41_09020 [Schaalia sp. ZJ405]|uniref:hypothetical protein n=1 Tax=Schaalia sp. ZJ405 TaxID=2709403 RepID=UPI0013EC05D4|nr:hypothetical protein [Schaalia sp. ZJ405]QPK81162.1 hypothetical protein G7Y41_09020 [Schaalia sp. ZJ405]
MNGNTLRLVRFLFLFFSRRLFVHSAMQAKYSKVLLLAAIAASYAGFCALTFIVVSGMVIDSESTTLIAQSISLTVGLWVLLFFIVIRVLFMKADKLIELTHTLPVTNKQRILAYTVFEAITVLSCVALMTGPLTISVTIHSGSGIFSEICLGIIGQAVVLYLLLDILYLSFDRLLQILHIARWRSFLIPCLFGAIFFGAYGYAQRESTKFLNAFYEGHTYYGHSRLYVLIYDRLGFPAAAGALLVSVSVAILMILLVAPNQHSRWKYFFRIPLGNSASLFTFHLRAVVRSAEFLLATALVIALSAIVLGIPGYYPPYWLAIISLQAVYAIPTTEALRKTYRHRLSPSQSYIYLAAPYILAELAIAIPVLAMSAINGLTFAEAGRTIFICLVTLVAALAISIFFPAEKHHPFSVLIGMMSALAIILLIAFTILIWQIPDTMTIFLWIAISGICIFYSVLGIGSTQRREYYADLQARS